ncbi:MAG: signal peptidase I, partial [Gammaproteobacteria bacterium]
RIKTGDEPQGCHHHDDGESVMRLVSINKQQLSRIILVLGLAGACVALLMLAARFISIGINVTDSLPGKIFVIVKHSHVNKGDIIAFYPPDSHLHQAQDMLIKQIVGIPGDAVWQQDSVYFINDEQVGFAFETTRKGLKLEPGPKGTIPEAHYFVATSHPYSFDSRYQEIGWINHNQIIGRVITLW